MSNRITKIEKILDSFFSNPYPKFKMNMDIEGIDHNYLKKLFKNEDFIRNIVIKINSKVYDLATLNDLCLCHEDFKNIIDSLIYLYCDEIIDRKTGHLILFQIMRNCLMEDGVNIIDESTKSTDNIIIPYYKYDFKKIKDFNIEDNLFMVSELGRFAKEINKIKNND